jgi:hypothetical protein
MHRAQKLRRSSCGNVFAECTLSFCLLSAVLVIVICLMTFIASFMHKRIQLEHLAQQAARFGINRVYYAGISRGSTDAQAETETANVIKPLLAEMGFTNATIVFKTKKIGKLHYGEITVSADAVTSTLLPVEVTIVDSAMAIESNAVPPYIAAITMKGGRSARIYVPAMAGGDWRKGPRNAWPGSLELPSDGPAAPGYGLIISNGAANARVEHHPGTPSAAGEY